MRTCPNCKKEVPDYDFTCPYCHQRMPSRKLPIKGHVSVGDIYAYNEKVTVSIEDKNMIRDKNHTRDSSSDEDDFDCAQPYSFITHENGDRN